MVPLWNHWSQPVEKRQKGEALQQASEMCTQLAPMVPRAVPEDTAKHLLSARAEEAGLPLFDALSLVPPPWSKALGDEYLRGLQDFVTQLDEKSSRADPWAETLSIAVTALPVECLAQAAESARSLKVPPENRNWRIQNFQTQLDNYFFSAIQLRTQIESEIAR